MFNSISLWEFIWIRLDFKKYFPFLDRYFFLDENQRHEMYQAHYPDNMQGVFHGKRFNFDQKGNHKQLLRVWYALTLMKEDFLSLWTSYKNLSQPLQDILALFLGVWNVISGFGCMVTAVLLLVVDFFIDTSRYFLDSAHPFKQNTLENIKRCGFWALEGILNLIRGFTQIVNFQLLAIKIPLRSLLTLGHILAMGIKKIEDNKEIYSLKNKIKKLEKKKQANSNWKIKKACQDLRLETKKAARALQSTNIKMEEVDKQWKAIYQFPIEPTEEDEADKAYLISHYLNLFNHSYHNLKNQPIVPDGEISCEM